ncbi:hypothetical protein KIO73_08125 [Chelatococcus asaccharovorans]|nr:hypothetical protein [Chelatococcus asaccharovorans]
MAAKIGLSLRACQLLENGRSGIRLLHINATNALEQRR